MNSTPSGPEQSESWVRQLLDGAPTPAFACDAEGYIIYFNRGAEKLWGRPLALRDARDRYCGSLKLSGPDGAPIPPEVCWVAATLADGQPRHEVEMTAEFCSGKRCQVLAYANPLFNAAGGVMGSINGLIDITRLHELERGHRALEEQLGHARKLEALGTLAGGVAHEFNNRLTTIMANIQMAEIELGSGHPSRGLLSEALESCRRARDQVARMLNFSRLAQGEATPQRLEELTATAIGSLRRHLRPGIEVRSEFEADLPRILCSADEIKHAIVQLGQNALAALPATGGRVDFDLRRSRPDATVTAQHPHLDTPGTQCLAVRDNGVGMDAKSLQRAFEPFFTTRNPGKGEGLGLAGVYGTIRRHRGAVTIESTPGRGTTVRLYFSDREPGGHDSSGTGVDPRREVRKGGR